MIWRILVTDDEAVNREIIAEYLDAPDYQLAMAGDGEEAWEHLGHAHAAGTGFDLLVFDRMMPRLGGMELLRRLKADDRFRHVPVIMQTAASSPEQVREGIAAGAYYYLTKPYDPEALLAVVHAALEDVADQRAAADAARTGPRFRLAAGQSQRISFRTLDEAHHLAGELACLCADPATVALGLTELLVNAIEHGNLGISYADKKRLRQADGWEAEVMRRLASADFGERRASITVERLDAAVRFTVEDQGQGFDWQRYLEFDPQRIFDPNGRGIAMARQVAFGSLEYRGCGNVVVATVTAADA